ncbi:MAG: hypothetical protein JJU18_01990 [Oceanicaulis sp.]|nr:hypothetical protein [Oceanicaulis sp.]
MADTMGAGLAKGVASGRRGQGGGGERLSLFTIFPKLLLAVVIYAAIAMSISVTSPNGVHSFVGTLDKFQAGQCEGMPTAGPDAGPCTVGTLNSKIFSMNLPSGTWVLTTSDLILIFALVMLFMEMIKAAGSGTSSLINHGLSMLTFLISMVLFLMVPLFATTTFFLLTMMSLVNVLGGFTITTIAARRDMRV